MIKIEIADVTVDTRQITTKRGDPMSLYSQNAYASFPGEKYPRPIQLSLQSVSPWPVGDYQLDPKSITTDKYNNLAIARFPFLRPLSNSAGK